MSVNTLILPMAAHICWTVFLYALLTAVRAPEVWGIGRRADGSNPWNEVEPRVSANLRNQFEWPLLFYVVCLLLLMERGALDPRQLWLAWIFVAGRVAHSAVQILTANVRARGIVFSINFIAVLGMWAIMLFSAPATADTGTPAAAELPSFDCGMAEAGSIEAMICADTELAGLDRKLAEVYAAARTKAVDEQPPMLKAEQRGWVKGRDECWKSQDERSCVYDEYRRRIAELQGRYRLVPDTGPVFYSCDGDPANEVVVTFFRTDPPTLYAERGDSTSLMFLEPSASGSKYQGRNETFWEHQGEARVTWGYQAPEMICHRQR